jgi:type IV pilus assembly protein PilO
MELSLSRMPWYAQVGAFALLGAVAAGVFWNWYAVPAREEITAREVELDGLRAEVARGLAEEVRMPELRAEMGRLDLQLGQLRQDLPEEQDVADLLRRVQAMATESRLAIRGFTPRAVVNRELYAEWPIGLVLEGTYHDLGEFLQVIGQFPRIINVTALNIQGQDADEGGSTITVECTATTFVLRDTPGAAPDGPAAD